MKYLQEDLAHDLHLALVRELESTSTEISVSGKGLHWHCTAQRDGSHCKIHCFELLGEAEYYTYFKRPSRALVTSRIPSREDTIAAVRDWLEGHDRTHLYERYPFIDREKRALTKLLEDVLAQAPALGVRAEAELRRQGGDCYYLAFRAKDRSCKISFYGKNELSDAKFSWDDCMLFQYQPDDSTLLSAILNRWICDRSMPSEMRSEFPWLHIGELADFYERGKPIEGEFVRSWGFIEQYYSEDWCTFSDSVLALIREIRQAGYDRLLRAGQSLATLGLSRSRRHGLRQGQPSIWFDFTDDDMNVQATFTTKQLEQHPIRLTQEVRELLDALVEFDID